MPTVLAARNTRGRLLFSAWRIKRDGLFPQGDEGILRSRTGWFHVREARNVFFVFENHESKEGEDVR